MQGNKKRSLPGISFGAPLVFIILYLKDLPLNIQDADDINILITDKNTDAVQERLNTVIKRLETWFSNNSLFINTD